MLVVDNTRLFIEGFIDIFLEVLWNDLHGVFAHFDLERIEANIFVFFLALLVQALIEREIREGMKRNQIVSLPLYSEDREAMHPTTSRAFDVFEHISTYSIMEDGIPIEEYKDELNLTHELVLRLMGITQDDYWANCSAFNMAEL